MPGGDTLPPILARRDSAGFWLAVVLTGAGTGLAAAALTGLLEAVQHLVWGGNGLDVLQAAAHALPVLLAVTTATLIARTIEPRSIYDARFSDTQVRDRQRARNRAMAESPV